MGQAKVRREALRRKVIEDGVKWGFPPTSWESEICEELKNETVRIVPCAPADWLILTSRRANECHANARWYAQNDPEQKIKFVTGWWVQWPEFVLHSVIAQDGHLVCVTPNPFGDEKILFIPDSKISWAEDGEVYSAIRNGQKIGIGVRAIPEFTIAQASIILELLSAGENPFNVFEIADARIAELRRKYCVGDSAVGPMKLER